MLLRSIQILAAVVAFVGAMAAADPLFDQLMKVRFINSGTVRASDQFVWGLTSSGRDPTNSAANPTAGRVLYLEEYNVSKIGSWGMSASTYLWQVDNISGSSSGMMEEGSVESGGSCNITSLSPKTDMLGDDMGVAGSASPAACGATCCATSNCGAFVWISVQEDPGACGNKSAGCCFLKNKNNLPAPTASGFKTIVSGTITGTPICSNNDPQHHFDTVGGSAPCPAGTDCNNVSSWEECRSICCSVPTCGTYTYVNGSKASNYRACYLRDMSSKISPSSNCAATNPTFDCYSGERPNRPSPPTPAPAPLNVRDPPSGMRSAVPLGGISCGAVELRADGSLHEWTIENQSPGGSGKVQIYPDAYFALRVGDNPPVAIQTHPVTPNVTGVSHLTYSGSYPVARLTPAQSDLADGLSAHLLAFSTYKINDMEYSARPMASFNLAVNTDASWQESNVSFMMNFPLAIESDMIRKGTPLGTAQSAESSTQCLSMCNSNTACASWNYNKDASQCNLQSDSPDMFYSLGTDSGLRSSWAYNATTQCLTLNRPGASGSNGDMSLCASGGLDAQLSYGTYSDGSGAFGALGSPGVKLNMDASGAIGAVLISAQIPPSTNTTLTINFGWHFPARDHFGKVFGNYYKNIYSSSVDAAYGLTSPGNRSNVLSDVVSNILAMQSPFHSSSLQPWLQDHLVNSLSHIRSAMWFDECPNCHASNDSRIKGFWRQWEAFDCIDFDSIHNDGERHIPYIMFWPDTTRNKLAMWAGNQGSDGMLAEQVDSSNPDGPQGRVMSDSTSMFICYILELLKWTGDTESLKLYYDTVKGGADWQMNVSSTLGVPTKLQTTYDILGLNAYQLSTYSSTFHIMAMEAASTLASAANDSTSAAKYKSAANQARIALDQLQWVNTTNFTAQTNSYCPQDYDFVGENFTIEECMANCTGSCPAVFLSSFGNNDCYVCKNPIYSNSTGYNLYIKSGAVAGAWAGASDNCTPDQGCDTQLMMFSDSLYAQVLAYTVGLGTIVSSEQKLTSHLQREMEQNCMHAEGTHLVPGCKNGVMTVTGRPGAAPGVTDWQIWEMAPPNRATLGIHTGEAPNESLSFFEGSATSWSQRVNDQWNTAGIKDTDGYPTVTSHYGYHMVSWHIPLALSGQQADLSSSSNRTLIFAPKLTAPYTLPIMLPGVLGSLSSEAVGHYSVILTVGSLTLDVLSVDGIRAPGSTINLAVGNPPVMWSN